MQLGQPSRPSALRYRSIPMSTQGFSELCGLLFANLALPNAAIIAADAWKAFLQAACQLRLQLTMSFLDPPATAKGSFVGSAVMGQACSVNVLRPRSGCRLCAQLNPPKLDFCQAPAHANYIQLHCHFYRVISCLVLSCMLSAYLPLTCSIFLHDPVISSAGRKISCTTLTSCLLASHSRVGE